MIDKVFSFGMGKALRDLQGREGKRAIDEKARSFIIKIARANPSDLGFANEEWANRLLTE